MPRWFPITICLVLLQLVLPVASFAERGKLTGSAELSFAGQTVETDGVKTLDANHFVQQYSLLWSKKGNVSNGRLGTYNVALGYEWSWVDSEINGEQVQIDNPLDKLLYRGEVNIAPGGLPFRLHAFSYDLHQTTFTSTDLGTLFDNDTSRISRGIITDINNGTHVTSGVTLEVGVQNGHYQGQYRDLLSTLPRLLIDYRQQEVHDINGPNPRDYVDRQLAFVSLNKKDNWLQYRRSEHEDKLDSLNNTSEDVYSIGTVDHNNRRQWVNLTNWIKVSSDISYTKENSQRSLTGRDNSRRYDINLFTKTSRTRWQLDNFTSFSRIRTLDRLERELEIPFYARGELNRDTSWRFQLESQQYDEEFALSPLTRSRDNIYMRGQVETYRQARYIVRPVLELETKSGSEGEGQSGKATLELYSNRNFRGNNEIFAGYSALYASGTGTTGADVSFLEQKLHLRTENQTSSSLRMGADQQLTYGTGSYDSTTSERIRAELASVGTFNGGSGVFDDSVFSSKSSAFVEISSLKGLQNRFDVGFNWINSDRVTGRQLTLTHRLDYNNSSAFSAYWINNYVTGDGMPGSNVTLGAGSTSNLDGTAASNADFSDSYATTMRMSYTPGRASRLSVTFDYEGSHYKDGSDFERFRGIENYAYTIWHVNGQIRKLLVMGQEVEYSKSSALARENENLLIYSLFSNYYPTSKTLLSARLSYEIDDYADTETLLTFLSAGVDFSLFKASVDYSYGHRPETATSPDVLEHKWEVKVKKTF